MTAKLSALNAAATDGSARIATTLRNRETRDDARVNSMWREHLAAMLGAHLANLDAMAHGFKVSSGRRRAGE